MLPLIQSMNALYSFFFPSSTFCLHQVPRRVRPMPVYWVECGHEDTRQLLDEGTFSQFAAFTNQVALDRWINIVKIADLEAQYLTVWPV